MWTIVMLLCPKPGITYLKSPEAALAGFTAITPQSALASSAWFSRQPQFARGTLPRPDRMSYIQQHSGDSMFHTDITFNVEPN